MRRFSDVRYVAVLAANRCPGKILPLRTAIHQRN
jgi:hypothetical protein